MDSRALERDLKKAIEFGKRSREWVDISVRQGGDDEHYLILTASDSRVTRNKVTVTFERVWLTGRKDDKRKFIIVDPKFNFWGLNKGVEEFACIICLEQAILSVEQYLDNLPTYYLLDDEEWSEEASAAMALYGGKDGA